MRTSLAIAGNLTSDPTFRQTKDGTHVSDFGLAHNDRRLDRATGVWIDGGTTFYTVSCWRTLADNVVACLKKGDAVVVQGWFGTHEYERRDGTIRSELRIEGQSVGPDLGRVVASVIRLPKPAPAVSSNPEPPSGSEYPAPTLVPRDPDGDPFEDDGGDEPELGPEPEFAVAGGPDLVDVAPGGRP